MSLFTGAAAAALTAGITGGSQVAGAALGAHGQGKAADEAAKGAQAALDFTKEQKAKQEAAYAPFASLGAQAAGQLPSIARQNPTMGPPAPYSTQPRATMPMQAAPLGQIGQNPTMPPPMSQPGQTVLLQAPDGSRKAVPANVADQLIARGAKRIG